jgi:hypothetical protein
MVLPLLAALLPSVIGAGGSIFSGILGSNAQQDAADQNYAIALMNYYQRQSEHDDSVTEARRQEGKSDLGTTDAQGNRSYFKPGVGWVTEMSDKSKKMQDLYENEEWQQLVQDLPAKRQKMFENIARQRGEGGYADAILQAMQRSYREDPSEIVGRRNRMSAEGITEGMDKTLNTAMRDAMRTGNTGAGKIASQIGREKSSMLRKAFMENEEGARGESENRFMTNLGNLGNLYNTFATRASGEVPASYNPRNLEGQANEQLSGSRSAGQNASGSLLNAIAKGIGDLDFKAEPMYGMANTVQTATNALTGAFERNQNANAYRDSYSDYDSYANNANLRNIYKEGEGLW